MRKLDWLAHHAQNSPHRCAVIDLACETQVSFSELEERAARIAGFLQRSGVRPGARIGVYAHNSARVLEVLFATWRADSIYMPINFRLTPPEIEYIVNDAEPDFVFFDSAFADNVSKNARSSSECQWVSLDRLNILSPDPERELKYDHNRSTTQMSDTAILMYSSGTTGHPKGVKISHRMIAAAITGISHATKLHRNMKSYAFMPLFHIGALIAFTLPAIFYGGCAVIDCEFDENRTVEMLCNPAHGITHVLALPTIFNRLLDVPRNPSITFAHIEGAFTGAEPVPKIVLEKWLAQGLNIQQGFGMTETTGVATLMQKDDLPAKIGSCGKPVFGCELKVVSGEGEPASPDELGEIWMRGPVVTAGYWKGARSSPFSEGWFKSGDIGRIDADGFVFIEDRVTDMYISGGENVYPAEVEAAILSHPDIFEVAIIGVHHPVWGEAGCAYVVRSGDQCGPDELREHCSRLLATYKIPDQFRFVADLPRNATGKVLKYKLRELV